VLAKLKRYLEAREIADSVTHESLQDSKQSILSELP